MNAHNKNVRLVVWDFDGVLCDSLTECMAVTKLAVHMFENPGAAPDDAEVRHICNEDEVGALYRKLAPLRPFIVRGQDYLWQYYHYESFKPCIGRRVSEYGQVYGALHSDVTEKSYERAFYDARRRLAAALGGEYLTLFRAFPGALDALRVSIEMNRNYICTNRDQNGVVVLLETNGIAFPRHQIFSKDFNGLEPNTELSKTEQVLRVLDAEGGRSQEYLVVEDQAKTPKELTRWCSRMRVVYATYGYGLRNDWDEAELPDCRLISRADQLLGIIGEPALR